MVDLHRRKILGDCIEIIVGSAVRSIESWIGLPNPVAGLDFGSLAFRSRH